MLIFYKRDNFLSSNEATNDDFAIDFISKVKGDILLQLLPTSPFIEVNDIDKFIKKMLDENLDTLVSVSDIQIESMYDGRPLNFDILKNSTVTTCYSGKGICMWNHGLEIR